MAEIVFEENSIFCFLLLYLYIRIFTYVRVRIGNGYFFEYVYMYFMLENGKFMLCVCLINSFFEISGVVVFFL